MLKQVMATAVAVVGVGLMALAQPESESQIMPQPGEDKMVYVHMKTSMGDIYLELDGAKAPITVENFVQYVKDEAYDGTIFHRVMSTFMIQGGGYDKDMAERETRKPIKNEWQNGLKNKKYTIAMARTGEPDSATSQFFINVVDNGRLDQPISGGAGYAVFGKVVKGQDVVDKIKMVPVAPRGMHQHVPVEPVVIEKVVVLDAAAVEQLGLRPKGEGVSSEDEGG